MEFKEWIKIKEEGAVGGAPAAAPAAPSGAAPAPVASVSHSGSTTSRDVAKVPQRMFGNRQTSDKCQNCSKDFWKNWYYTKKKRKK